MRPLRSSCRAARTAAGAAHAVWPASCWLPAPAAPLRLLPPVDLVALLRPQLERPGDEDELGSPSARPAELPQFTGRFRVAVDYLVGLVHVELAGAVAVERPLDT